MGRHKKNYGIVLPEDKLSLDEEESGLTKVDAIRNMSGKNFFGFSGNSYNHSLQLAKNWIDMKNNEKGSVNVRVLVDYYSQIHTGKSILVSYNLEPRGDQNEST